MGAFNIKQMDSTFFWIGMAIISLAGLAAMLIGRFTHSYDRWLEHLRLPLAILFLIALIISIGMARYRYDVNVRRDAIREARYE